MVHHLQNVGELKFECPQEREQLAYKAQERWLGLFGRDLLRDFKLDLFTIFCEHQVWVLTAAGSRQTFLTFLAMAALGQERTSISACLLVSFLDSDVLVGTFALEMTHGKPCALGGDKIVMIAGAQIGFIAAVSSKPSLIKRSSI